MRYWMPLFAVLSLAGCKTMAEVHSEADDNQCLSYGVQRGSPPYVECRMALARNRSNEQAASNSVPSPAFPTYQPIILGR